MMTASCVIITGTSRGLGRALAQFYLRRGEYVVGCSRSAATLTDENYIHYPIDVSDEPIVADMFSDVRRRRLQPRLLINNAAVTQASLGAFTSSSAAMSVFQPNVLGNFIVSREALKIMHRNKFGRIVNLTSINVPLASTGSAIYNASKAAIDALGRTLANEFRSTDITINSIGLSVVSDTSMADALSDKALEDKTSKLMKPSLLTSDEIAHAIEFFAAPSAKNITGQVLYFGGVR
jgi:3-oxoacyl-[acyl-carrier protein] reductase